MDVSTSTRGSRWRTVLLAALFTATIVAVDAAPVSLPAPIAEVFGPEPAKAGFCASNAAFTGHLTGSEFSTTALTRTIDPIVYAYISNVQAAWSCTLYYRYSGVTFNTSATLGTFRWGNLINSQSVVCNYAVGSTNYIKSNSTADCPDTDDEYALRTSLNPEGIYQRDLSHDTIGDFSFVQTDCGTYYGGAVPPITDHSWSLTTSANRPGTNCDSIDTDDTNTAQTIVVDSTPPAVAFDWPLAGGPALVTSAFAAVKFDATDNVAGFLGTNDWELRRQKATWSGSACGTYADDPALGSLVTGATNALDQVSSQGLLDNTCYRWTLTATDANGNPPASATSGSIRTSLTGNLGQQPQHTFESWDLGAGDGLAVNVGTGNLVVSHPLVDLPIRGGSFGLGLTYNRHDTSNVGMGPGWRLDAFRRLLVNADSTVIFTDADGSRHQFTAPTGSPTVSYTRPATLYATLTRDTAATPDRFTLTYRDRSVDTFDLVGSSAYLETESDRFGNAMSFTHDASNQLTLIEDPAGRDIVLTWSVGKLVSVKDWAVISGGVVQTSGTPNRTHRFFYDGSGNLAGWADPLNSTDSCPTSSNHLTCITYLAGELHVAKRQRYATFSAGVIATSTRPVTTKVTFDGLDVTTVKDAQEDFSGTVGTSFSHVNPFQTQVVRRGTSGASLDTTTRYTLLTAADTHARIATVGRKLGAAWITETTTYDATYPIEVATVTEDDGGSLERATTYQYVAGSLGLLLLTKEPLTATPTVTRRWTQNTYNANNDVTQLTVSLDGSATERTVTRYCYNANLNACGTADIDLRLFRTIENYVNQTKGEANGHVEDVTVEYQYDGLDQRVRETRYNYASGGAELDSRATGFEYDTSGNVTKEIVHYADGAVDVLTPDDITPNASTNARTDLTTVHAYDTAGNRVSTADPRRAIEAAKGTSLAADDFIMRWSYDSLDKRVTEKTPTTPGVTITQQTSADIYDELGKVRHATDFGGIVSAAALDRAGRVIETYRDTPISAAIITGKSAFDPSGRVLWSEDEIQANDPTGGTDPGRIETVYDELGRPATSIEAAGSLTPMVASTTTTTYDALDRVAQSTVGTESAAAQTTKTGYDPGDRVVSLDDEFTCTTTTYDWRDLAMTTIEGKISGSPCTGAGTRTINQLFDDLGRMTSRAVAGGDTLEASVLDAAGRATKTWSASGTTSRIVETTYNALDEATTEYRYTDTAGVKSAEGWARSNRDAADNETDRCTWTAAPNEWCKQADGTFAYPQPATKSSSRYDARNNRIEQYTPGLGATTYDPAHNYQVAGVYVPTAAGKEHQTLHTFDERHRLDTITHVLCTTAQRPCIGGNVLSTTLVNDYGHDANDNRTQVTENNGSGATTRHYCHDARNQLVGAYSASGCSTGLLEAYAYDAASNRISAASRTFTYTTAGQLATCSVTACNPVFDADGRLTRITTATGTWSYLYDGQSRLASACQSTVCTGSGFARLEMSYDGEGHRTRLVETPPTGSATTTSFSYEGDTVSSETATNGTTVVTRTFTKDEAGAIIKMTIATTPTAGADDGIYLVNWNGHGDALALSEINATDGTLTPAARIVYSTWGAPTITAQPGYGSLGFRYLYVGRFDVQWDNFAGAGVQYMYARHYSPEFGRFLQPDPSAQDENLYAYAANAPATLADPDGLHHRRNEGFGGGGGSGSWWWYRGKIPTGLLNASHGLQSVFRFGSIRGRSIIGIRADLLRNGFRQSLARNKKGYLLTRGREEVRIMRVPKRGWQVRIRNRAGNNLDEFGNVARPSDTHGIFVHSK